MFLVNHPNIYFFFKVALKSFQDDSTVKNEHCACEIAPVLDGTETATPREHRTEATH